MRKQSLFWLFYDEETGFPGGASGEQNQPANARDIQDTCLISRQGRSPGGGHGSLLQYCLENPVGRGYWQATVHRVAWSQSLGQRHTGTHGVRNNPRARALAPCPWCMREVSPSTGHKRSLGGWGINHARVLGGLSVGCSRRCWE